MLISITELPFKIDATNVAKVMHLETKGSEYYVIVFRDGTRERWGFTEGEWVKE